ncbi:MAG: B12-binding domain-containing radical SAM protein [Gammaproteobacteria bacterium]|jgi:radical SAM superfamily enzyme YgiQ (UPF0313 family)|nr:B12-binding domain-containing radical SAM protein [Gammaproteobacteria bacterium]MBT3724618.1 B12-binding domain-containing radical SAM protein [Gammaproteobacteria bacterium]MBT4078566.1 B12-binding domain-containing radical SAM protein [Gammaproteobacteria bacterium]MBT4195796.1 B12-binding domain-containing radical SAM protein [Gammaproteobacteria bacterium]MBT4448114.1 B12-binding domain-containing radical SAM protein [Gammaproteobacteria bacterium]
MMTRGRVLLIGYEDQDNLGLRYLSSRLKQHDHQTMMVKMTGDSWVVEKSIHEFKPHVVGFSLIFQYLLPNFRSLIKFLRDKGINAHFTIGGHYASFEYQGLLNTIPELDSVARFEAEDTLLELTEKIVANENWRGLPGLAWRDNFGIQTVQRQGRMDLDELPFPDRDNIQYESQGLPTAAVLGSRGCAWSCSFCSIITFYAENGTKGRRMRDPVKVVDELEYLHKERGVRVILWQDDDFLAGGKVAYEWAKSVAIECIRRHLQHGLRWKISCRSNEVRQHIIEPLVEAGLTHIYLGVEAGDENDLKHLNKLMRSETHLRAASVIERFDLSFDFGFMLMNPWSTYDSVRNNIDFLLKITDGGRSVNSFCRMLPYVGTPVAERLASEGRLDRQNLEADYNFLDVRLDRFYEWQLDVFQQRNFQASGTQNLLRLLQFESCLKLPDHGDDSQRRNILRCLTEMDNLNCVDILRTGLDYFFTQDHDVENDLFLQRLKEKQQSHDFMLKQDLARFLGNHPASEQLLHATR